MIEDSERHKIEAALAKAGVGSASRHLFVCIGPECCGTTEGETLWESIKKRVRETGLTAMRTKAGCFRVCVGGPLIVVYPEGIWYANVTPERFETILQQHLLGGVPVNEWILANNTLSCKSLKLSQEA